MMHCGKRLRTCLLTALALVLTMLWKPVLARAVWQGDSSRAAINIGLTGHTGFIIPHSRDIRDISGSNPWGIEADVSLHFTNERAWQYLQGYPRLGAALAYYNFDNPEVLGSAYTLLLYAEPFLSAHRRFSLSFRFGAGLAYMDNIYDPDTNPDNLFYSTRISFPLEINLLGNYRLSERWMLRAGGTYKHISNGGLRQPNKGINFPSATLGLSYTLRPATFPVRQASAGMREQQKRHFLVALFGTGKDRRDEPSSKLPLLGITAYVSQPIGRISALTGGAEWIADYTLRKYLEDDAEGRNFQRGALLVGHELRIGRFRFNQQLGVYVYAPYKARDPVYQRWGLEYHTDGRMFYGINLKAHRHVADFLDARVGLRF
ncbi:Lipid A 3-O-deacylase (PagL) [Pontibacter indicus]|uniref:Lipid A 3-O-deacylase (PagL) n=1 Tax=Pontibacter indicus TaxID=1317125 RepID=A0A1R3WA65_9BACT|nr:Lipid A 3-O-deacylase (PagL) [Pontibacter indicus]